MITANGKQVAHFGSWRSTIRSDSVAIEATVSDVIIGKEDIWWLELRPAEGGRCVIMHRAQDGSITDVTPSNFSARTLVHEYGGGAFCVNDRTVYFSNCYDQRLYSQRIGSEPRPITSEGDVRYADGVVDSDRRRIVCVQEDHSMHGKEPVNSIVSVDMEGKGGAALLVSGNDFYSSPRLSPDGSLLAWLTWNHPNMPFDGTELWIAEVNTDGVGHARRIAGGSDESISQPSYSADCTLHFISDCTGWWNLYRFIDGKIEPLTDMAVEFCRPQWFFGLSTYAFESEDQIVCAYDRGGIWHLATLDTRTHRLEPIESPYTEFEYLKAAPGRAVFVASSPLNPQSVVWFDTETHRFEVLYGPGIGIVRSGYLSIPESLEFPGSNGVPVHAFFYRPQNSDYCGPQGELPPLIVMCHGGPTDAASTAFDMTHQYWTSRGFALLDVNYRGSTGFGRAYRQLLQGQWGKGDVDDCVSGADYVARKGKADRNRIIIRGGSAGGYTVLCALTFRDIFEAGASYAGISDLVSFKDKTHKFESHYLDKLIGSYASCPDQYHERSPINFVDRMSAPVILFQGLEDKVVPPNQSYAMFEALQKKGIAVAYVGFEGEQHGFRREESVKRSLDAELYFYSRIFGFELPESIEPVQIKNLERGPRQR